MKDLTVLKAKRYEVYTARGEDTLQEAARKMAGEDISALVVVDEVGCLRGITTRLDLIRMRYARDDWTNLTMASAMSDEVVTVSPQDTLAHVMALLLKRHIHRVVVVRQEPSGLYPVGVLSAADIVYHMAGE